MTAAPVFKETYESYLTRIGDLDVTTRQAILGIELRDAQAVIPFFNTTYFAGANGIFDLEGRTPNLSVCVILCKYLLMCPREVPRIQGLAAFQDFKDAAPLIPFFSNAVQGEVARCFSGNLRALDRACGALGARPYEGDLGYQIKYRFEGLPRVPVYLLFNDAEEGFGAQCTLLFERRAESFLDMESVAMLAGALAHLLSPAKQ